MLKKLIVMVLLAFACTNTRAQTADAIYDQYLDFNLARYEGKGPKALLIGESLLPNVAKLPANSQVLYYNSLAKLYEDSSDPDKAITYYEKVIAAQPDYYVPHRALGYLYADKAKELYKQIQAGKGNAEVYKAATLKALPHLEKAQACDPSDETLTLIKFLYNSIKDAADLTSLNARLTTLSKNCITVLSE